MKILFIPKSEDLDLLLKQAKKLFGSGFTYSVYPDCPDDIEIIFFEKGLRRTAEEVNKKRVRTGLSDLPQVEVRLQKPKTPRAPRNPVRKNILQILRDRPLHGYAIYQEYRKRFGDVSLRLIYYHLSKGVREGFFEIDRAEPVEGDFSWGRQSVRKIYRVREQT